MIALLFASILGGTVTLAALWPYGALLAFLCAPFGGSLLALLAAVLVAYRRRGENLDLDLDQTADQMVALLNKVAQQGRQREGVEPISTDAREGPRSLAS